MEYYKFYSCCFPVKGAQRGLICDVQRGSYIYLPNELIDALFEFNGKKFLISLINMNKL